MSKKLTSPLRCLSLKKFEEPEDESEQLKQPVNDPYQDLETAYVAHVCLTWEALHCQYTQLSQKISCHPENSSCYNYSAQQFQQFQVLLQRFVENEPFEQGLRADIYARTRKSLPKLLQVPIVQGKPPLNLIIVEYVSLCWKFDHTQLIMRSCWPALSNKSKRSITISNNTSFFIFSLC